MLHPRPDAPSRPRVRALAPLLLFTSATLLWSGCADKPKGERPEGGKAEGGKVEGGKAEGHIPERTKPGAGPAARATQSAAVSTRARAGAPPPPAARIPEADVRALVTAWQAAQNGGDLPAYLALYAQRFVGVKRVAQRTRRYDRKGWAADRGRMFQKKMTVATKELTVAAHSQSAIVRFHQTWASGDFKDEGPKQLVVVREGGKLRIAREEMLASTVLTAPTLKGIATPDLTGGRFLMIAPVTADHALHVILEHRPQASWAKPGYRTLLRRGLVVRDVDEGKLPAALRAWKGKRLHVYAEGKRSCEVMVRGLALLAEVVPHFGTVQEWEGQRDGRKRTDAEVAQATWNLATGNTVGTQRGPGLWLVALLDKDRKTCPGGATWARDAALPPPVIWPHTPAAPLAAKGLAALRALGAWKQLQQEFRRENPKGSWDLHDGAKPRVRVFRHPTDGRRLVVVSARAGAGCGQFEGQVWAAWEVRGTTWTRLTRAETGQDLKPVAVFGAAGDGPPQILDPFALVVPAGKLYRVSVTYEPPFYDCGC